VVVGAVVSVGAAALTWRVTCLEMDPLFWQSAPFASVTVNVFDPVGVAFVVLTVIVDV
jgi:hypothetical protein